MILYCSIFDVKNMDIGNITTDISDTTILEYIEIATYIVNYYTRRSFTPPIPLPINKATAIITIDQLEKYITNQSTSISTSGNIKKEDLGDYNVEVFGGDTTTVTTSDIPNVAELFLKPFILYNYSNSYVSEEGVKWYE